MNIIAPSFNRNKAAYGIMIHPNGPSGGAAKDESPYERTVTAGGGGAIIDYGRFGKSLKCRNATSDYYSIAYSAAAHNLGAGDFGLGFWANFYDVSYMSYFLCQWYDQYNFIYTIKDSQANSNKLYFRAMIGGVEKASYVSGNLNFNNSQDYYFEFSRSGSAFYIFVDGISLGLNTITAISTNDLDIAGNWEINLYRGDTRYGDYAMSEVTLMKGRAGHTANYTPPTRRQ